MAVIPTRDFKENKYLVFATAKGQIKKTEFIAYNTPIKADGIIAIKIRDGDELVQVRLTSGEDDILMVSHSGHASRFAEKLVRPMGRGTSGVKGMNVSAKGNRVLAMDIARDDTELFVVTENGYGKRTPVSEYPVKGRGTKGVLTAKLTEKKGGLAGALIVREHQDLLFISQNGMVQRTSVSGHLADGPADPGRQGDEHQGRRPGQRRRAGGRVRRPSRAGNGTEPGELRPPPTLPPPMAMCAEVEVPGEDDAPTGPAPTETTRRDRAARRQRPARPAPPGVSASTSSAALAAQGVNLVLSDLPQAGLPSAHRSLPPAASRWRPSALTSPTRTSDRG